MTDSCDFTRMLLITANVGSIFEDPKKMLLVWLDQVTLSIKAMAPGFIALHCQEIGGKNFQDSMQYVSQFVSFLMSHPVMQVFDRARIFIDEDFTAEDKFTALGSLYFIRSEVKDVEIYDFEACHFVPVVGREVLSGNIESVTIKDKAKFPQHFFPKLRWSRKGYLRSRWRINGSSFDLLNIHNFHDASNIVSVEKSPSVYSGNRKQALLHIVDSMRDDQYSKIPYAIFGDFNFRPDQYNLLKKLVLSAKMELTSEQGETAKIVYLSENDKPIVTVEKKYFYLHDSHHDLINMRNCNWLREFDSEVDELADILQEYPVTFSPSYPFSEDVQEACLYTPTRCPAWCDRVLFGNGFKETALSADAVTYDMMGIDVCMGDHKPIFVNLCIRHNCDGEDLSSLHHVNGMRYFRETAV